MIVALLVGVAQPVWAAPAVPMVHGIRIDAATGRLVVTTTGDVVPQITQLANPPRLVVDFPGQVGAEVPRQLAGWLPAVKGVRLAQFQPEIGRLVFDLDQPMDLDVERQKVGDGTWQLLFRLVGAAPAPIENSLQTLDATDQALTITTAQPVQPLLTQTGNRVTVQIPKMSPNRVPNLPMASALFDHLAISMVGDTMVLQATLTRPEPVALTTADNGRMLTIAPRAPWARLQFQHHNDESEAKFVIRGDRRFTYHVERQDNKIVITTTGTFADEGRQLLGAGVLNALQVRKGEASGSTVIALETPKPAAYAIGLSDDGRTLAVTIRRDASRVAVAPVRQGAPLIVLDPGHGGNDPGAIGPGGTHEANVTLAVIRYLEEELKQMGWRTSLARTDDSEIDLAPRVAVANKQKADLFVSVHCNSLDRNWVKGIETYYRNPFSVPLAKKLHASLVGKLGSPDRGIRYANFYVIHHTTMPAVLCEIGYVSHPEEERNLADPVYQRRVAKAIAEGLKSYWADGGK
jgi:N-acetylmuramoyl-L-alanine amidase